MRRGSPGPFGVVGRLPLRDGPPILIGVMAAGVSAVVSPASAAVPNSACTVTGPERSTRTACTAVRHTHQRHSSAPVTLWFSM